MARVDPSRLRWWLPYRTLFADGILRLKGNGLMAFIEYRGPDLDDVLNEELLVLAERLGGHLGQFGRQMGWTLNAEVRVVPAAGYRKAPAWLTGEEGDEPPRTAAGVAEDPAKALDAPAYLDDLRRRRFAGRLYEQRTFLCVAMRPGSGLAKALERYLKSGSDTIAERWGPYLEDFRDFARTFTATLDALFAPGGGWARRLDGSGVLRYLSFAIDGQEAERLVFPADAESEALHRLIDRRLLIGRHVRLDGLRPRPVRSIGILGLPDWHRPELLAELSRLGFPLRVCQRFRVINPHVLQGAYRKQLKLAADQRHGIGARVLAVFRPGGTAALEPDAVGMARFLVAQEETGGIAFAASGGALTTTAVTWGEDDALADARAEALIEAFDAAGFKSVGEGVNAPAAYFSSFPGTIERNRRRDTLTEGFLVRRMRLTAPWTGPHRSAGPFGGPPLVQAMTNGCAPFRFDPYVSEAGHFAVISRTRGGKSTLLCFLGQQWLALHPEGRVVFLDVDADKSASVVSALAAGGVFMSFRSGGLALQPLLHADDPDVRMELGPWLRDLVSVQGYAHTPAVGAAIDEALALIATEAPERRTMSALRSLASIPELRRSLWPAAGGGEFQSWPRAPRLRPRATAGADRPARRRSRRLASCRCRGARAHRKSACS
jgi:type IV secretion system protein VirB4